jgi:hypothetical protein
LSEVFILTTALTVKLVYFGVSPQWQYWYFDWYLTVLILDFEMLAGAL